MMLGEFLKVQAGSRDPWNCSTLAADWCLTRGHPDFAAAWRHVTEQAACEDAPKQAGGLLALWELGIGDNLPIAAAPYQPADIAVIHALGLEAGAIFTGDKWALKTARGVNMVRLDERHIVKAWRP